MCEINISVPFQVNVDSHVSHYHYAYIIACELVLGLQWMLLPLKTPSWLNILSKLYTNVFAPYPASVNTVGFFAPDTQLCALCMAKKECSVYYIIVTVQEIT